MTDQPALDLGMSGARFSEDGVYRYELWRKWDPALWSLVWIMLNPSTADADRDDPTIRRVIRFSKAWDYGGCIILNLYALRSTDPRVLRGHPDPVGPENDETILGYVRPAGTFMERPGAIVAAWGAHPAAASRQRWLAEVVDGLDTCPFWTLGLTPNGSPRHPLYVPSTVTPVPFRP